MQTAHPANYQLSAHDMLLDEAEYILRVQDLPDDERPREKMLAAGVDHLSQAELVAVLWGVGTRKEGVLSMARRTLQEYGEHMVLRKQMPAELARTLDIPLVKACQLMAAFELGRRAYATARGGRAAEIRTPAQAFEYFRSMGENSKEQLRGLYLGSRHQVVHDEIISIGSLTSNIVHPREVFQPAVEYGAVAVIIAHNHPSGSLDPSAADLETTRQLIAAGKILGIDLLDHLIITTEGHASILEQLL
ncbi:MAG TPA: DNA repair protein RadC [Candidatus Saccharimonadales bacterium]|nr:DNA repair protein RadC [Candidatus Saccharimonadales bacterium]